MIKYTCDPRVLLLGTRGTPTSTDAAHLPLPLARAPEEVIRRWRGVLLFHLYSLALATSSTPAHVFDLIFRMEI